MVCMLEDIWILFHTNIIYFKGQGTYWTLVHSKNMLRTMLDTRKTVKMKMIMLSMVLGLWCSRKDGWYLSHFSIITCLWQRMRMVLLSAQLQVLPYAGFTWETTEEEKVCMTVGRKKASLQNETSPGGWKGKEEKGKGTCVTRGGLNI